MRVVIPVLLALGALVWFAMRQRAPEPPMTAPDVVPQREVFHASKPLRIFVSSAAANSDKTAVAQLEWLERELRQLLIRGKMQLASRSAEPAKTFALQVTVPVPSSDSETPAALQLRLIAPDEIVEREHSLSLPQAGRLEIMRALATALPDFLGAAHASTDWREFLGTEQSEAYNSYTRAAVDILGRGSQGYTQLQTPSTPLRAVERLETLTRTQPGYARAWATLAIGYLSLGGEDDASLTKLAETAAERALSLDRELAEAHAALGLVQLRRTQWLAAKEYFEAALAIDADLSPAAEGLACLLTDVGHGRAALPIAQRVVALQPQNAGARECATYASMAVHNAGTGADMSTEPFAVRRVYALMAVLARDTAAARRLLQKSADGGASMDWVEPLLKASTERRAIPDALQAITRAADEGDLDPASEILCGAALRQSDFVFNRMLRLQRQNEPIPLRVLWLPQTKFLRQHARFEDLISAASLLPYWQEYGLPDVCQSDTTLQTCKVNTPARVRNREYR